ncbi:hypothetical protein GGTG_03233 [Gaeumannomyces tritici R3-111a-1]|uniref:Uncharacterized protein n=1 Tax=Gaeumannomyces tritici (strain R3-111a-1) TaxID=644352 RepID=J3NPM6_GAET3|nr:hypothetical protein GGTG_03233 [Gaeumannomyces tritici R3-111a-1]EJT78131.1 hypothetical protein GGTG_03233 [Gaeumannomyces tritici R3-111a-1]
MGSGGLGGPTYLGCLGGYLFNNKHGLNLQRAHLCGLVWSDGVGESGHADGGSACLWHPAGRPRPLRVTMELTQGEHARGN